MNLPPLPMPLPLPLPLPKPAVVDAVRRRDAAKIEKDAIEVQLHEVRGRWAVANEIFLDCVREVNRLENK